VHVPFSKSGKARHVHLTDEGVEFFGQVAAGKEAGALLFPRADGAAWGQAHQFRPITEACKAAKIRPTISFHVLRHTYPSRLAMKGVPMAVIAEQLGHADTRMTDRHYAPSAQLRRQHRQGGLRHTRCGRADKRGANRASQELDFERRG